MELTNEIIVERLQEQFPNSLANINVGTDNILSFDVEASKNFELMKFMKEDAQLRFNFLTDICGVHYPDYPEGERFAVVYHLHNWYDNIRVRFKCFLNGTNPEIKSVVELFAGANWQERETYDFYGIKFKGHPQLKRILNMDEMTVFPLRKEYPMEDMNRTDKDDRFFGRTTIK
ncbi:MAG: NADH-quinone oxidoreductase subunit C [Bacteroidota bacterium]|nr:NADH-quinone oxidoreductase subunit C [Bacteroidota bacterium]